MISLHSWENQHRRRKCNKMSKNSKDQKSSKSSKLKLKKNEGRSPSLFCNSKSAFFWSFLDLWIFAHFVAFSSPVLIFSRNVAKSWRVKISKIVDIREAFCNNVLSQGHETCNDRQIVLLFSKLSLRGGIFDWQHNSRPSRKEKCEILGFREEVDINFCKRFQSTKSKQ